MLILQEKLNLLYIKTKLIKQNVCGTDEVQGLPVGNLDTQGGIWGLFTHSLFLVNGVDLLLGNGDLALQTLHACSSPSISTPNLSTWPGLAPLPDMPGDMPGDRHAPSACPLLLTPPSALSRPVSGLPCTCPGAPAGPSRPCSAASPLPYPG